MRWSRAAALLAALAACGKDTAIRTVLDVEEPYFESVLSPNDTYSTTGPYVVEAMVSARRGVQQLVVHLTDDAESEQFVEAAMALAEGDLRRGRWSTSLPGRPAGSAYYFFLVLVDGFGVQLPYPEDAPATLLGFRILPTPN